MARITLEASRVNAHLTQAEMADKMGVSRTTVINWESGKTEMKTAYFIAWCHIVGMSENDILLPVMAT